MDGMVARTRDEGLGPEAKRRILLGAFCLSKGYYEAFYVKAQKARTLIARDFAQAFGDIFGDLFGGGGASGGGRGRSGTVAPPRPRGVRGGWRRMAHGGAAAARAE